MAPDADFIDAASQDASYYFMNTAPQFQIFNNGNWKYDSYFLFINSFLFLFFRVVALYELNIFYTQVA
jgi:hypothetical protein